MLKNKFYILLISVLPMACSPSLSMESISSSFTKPSLAYTSSEVHGAINLALSISPTTLDKGGGLTSCEIKSGSTNASSFPSTLSINPTTCVISGTPTAILSSTQFTLVATNSAGTSSDATITISVSGCNANGSPFGGGSGTGGSPYEICSITQLSNMRNYLSASFSLKADLDLSSISNWTPVGTPASPFTGSFEGNSLTLSNLTINSPSSDDVGLFGTTSTSGPIQYVTLSNVNIHGNDRVGALIGSMANTHVTLTVRGITVSGSVQGRVDVGGIGGYWNVSGTSTLNFMTSSSSAIVTGAGGYVGGILGRQKHGTVSYVSATGNVTCTGSASDCYVGGLLGSNHTSVDVTNSFATGAVSGYSSTTTGGIGGLLGQGYGGGGRSNVQDCYARGTVTGLTGNQAPVGGLIGWAYFVGNAVTITRDYASGGVSGNGTLGGLVGTTSGGVNVVNNSYWDTETTGQASSALGTGKTSSELFTQGTYTGWNFTTVWNAPATGTYPTLR